MKLQLTNPNAGHELAEVFESMHPALRDRLEAVATPCCVEDWEERCADLWKTLEEVGDQECPFEYKHSFPDGIYYRQVTKGPYELVVGRRHALESENILLAGEQIVFTHEGPLLVKGPTSFTSKAGSRKVTLTLSPVVFANVFPNPDNCQDVAELERRLEFKEENLLTEVAV